jgi:cyclohexa-1,5-dienecarbonyl-CoA hydratase
MDTMVSLRVERLGAVARMVLDRPPLNVLDTVTLCELDATFAELDTDPGVKVALLTGAGRAFCAGVDVADHTGDRVVPMLDAFHGLIRRMLDLDLTIVAAVNGAALGGGCELLLGCDVVLASATAKIGQPEIRLGVFPPVAAALLPRRIGPQAAADLLLSGCTIDANEAWRIGLVNHVCRPAELAGAALDYANGLARLSRPVLRLTKQALRDGYRLGTDSALDRADVLYRHELMRLHDAGEGIAAFVEKREPVWKEA